MTGVYKSGQVAASLFTKKKSSAPENDSLAKLFTATKMPKVHAPFLMIQAGAGVGKRKVPTDNKVQEQSSVPAKKRKIVKKKGTDKNQSTSTSPPDSEFPFQHETLAQKTDKSKRGAAQPKKKKTSSERKKEDEIAEKRPRRNRKRDKTSDKRTVFVGNCPLSADKKTIKNLFKDYGEIESIRFRCAPAAEPNLPRRAIVITKNFHDKCNNYISYVVFKDEEAANKALERNGFVLDGLHLRVDIAASAKKHDKKRSVFIGNLPFDVQEDEVRGHFSDCGDIVNVRIVRDRQTSLGKGICFIHFESKDSVSLSLKLNKSEFQGRQLRVMACTNKAKKKEEKSKSSEAKKKDTPTEKDKKKKISFAPSNATSSSFKTILKTKKEKRLRKLKKKTSAKKGDKLTAILGEAPVLAPKMKKKKMKKTQGPAGTGKGLRRKNFNTKGKQGGKNFKGAKKTNKKGR